METYDVRCPICGELNHNLYLEETDGWMECEHCHQAVQILAYAKRSQFLFIPAGSWQKIFDFNKVTRPWREDGLMQEKEIWRPFSWHCPNCGEISVGYKNSSGTIKVECSKCHAVMVRKVMGRRHDRIDIYAPKGEVNETGRLASL